MKIPTTSASCAICGGSGIATRGDEADQWMGAILIHTDQRVCIATLENKERAKQEKENCEHN